jgi:putative endonuclease
MTARRRLGQSAEDLAAARLAAAGWRIVERNARTRYGELDIVALDEVKAGRQGSALGPERPILAVDARKQRRVRRLATAWLAERRRGARYSEIRFDAIGITFDRSGRAVGWEHLRAAF